jgi:MFS family permease
VNKVQAGRQSREQSAESPFGFRFVAPLALGSMLNPINSTMISTALVPIAREFHATVADTSLLIGGLYITRAIAQPTMGRLADRLGARRVFLAGLYLIALCGVAGRFAPSLRALIWVRVLLGVGTGSELPRVSLSILSMSAMATVALGPALGGILTGFAGWRAIFLVNLPLAMIGMLLVLLWIPEDEPRPNGLRRLVHELDFIGIGCFASLLLAGMVFLMSLIHPKWWVLALFVLLGVLLVRHSLRRHEPRV